MPGISTLLTFYNFLLKTKQYKVYNPFKFVKKPANGNKNIIKKTELYKLLAVITRENGIELLPKGKKRNHYFPWIENAIWWTFYSGRRPEEVVKLKYSDIICDEDNGSLLVILGEDEKSNKLRQVKPEDFQNKKYFYAPFFPDFKEFLLKQGYEQYINADRYLIAPEVTERKCLSERLSRAFTHFWKLSGNTKKVTLYNLRKTYITKLSLYTNGNARSITGHSCDSVVDNHYNQAKAISEDFSKGNFSIF